MLKSTRRHFFKVSLAAAATSPFLPTTNLLAKRASESVRNRSPYQGLNWDRIERVHGATHIHIGSPKILQQVYEVGLRFFTASNYYPSAPYFPFRSMKEGQFRPSQKHGVMHKGRYVSGPIDWNSLILDPESGWAGELEEPYRKELPFKAGKAMFRDIPSDIIEAPNAEHHSFTDSCAHINSVGSLFASGTFDVRCHYKLQEKGYARGTGMKWRDAFTRMLAELVIADGGGITINHPIWSNLPIEQAKEMLDFDPRVLGIEVHNDGGDKQTTPEESARGEKYWDDILVSGRQCFGFFTPDWRHCYDKNWKGRCILLVENPTMEACLRAYRRGQFYGAFQGNGFAFRRISADKRSIEVELDRPGRIEFITEKGIVKIEEDTLAAEYHPPRDAVFIRVKACDKSGEVLFSQPTML